MKTAIRFTRRCWLAILAMLVNTTALAGPPLLCDPFDTAGARSLEWGGEGWNQPLASYDLARLADRTQSLLTSDTPVIERMETLRRAAIYASRDGETLREMSARFQSRIEAAQGNEARALALFDAGYFLETLQDIDRLQDYDMPGIGRVDRESLRELLNQPDGSLALDQALALRPDDAGLRFAAALVAVADGRTSDLARHSRQARKDATGDQLIALNLDLISR